MRIAVAGSAAGATAADGVLGAAAPLAAAAAAAGAGLLLLPRPLADGGRAGGDPGAAAELSDGPRARAMGALAREAGLAIAYGYVERCSGALFDSVLLVDRSGCHLANYRRAHTGGAGTDDGFARGQWLSTMPVAGRRVGFLIGYDLLFPEAARALRLAGCDLLLVAGGLDPGAAVEAAALLPARALENRCAIAFAGGGPAPTSAAAVVGPDGRQLGRPAGDRATGLVLADLPDDAGPAAGPLPDRRPRLYARLTLADPAAEQRV